MLPKKLKKGDTIGIVAPSKNLNEFRKGLLEKFKKYAEDKLELKIIYGKHIFETNKFGDAAGTAEQRAEDINEMFSNKEIDAIWCYQGGNHANQVLDLLDYSLIKNNPKLFLGMSDVDVLSLAINKMTGLITFNTPDSKRGRDLDLDFNYSQEWFIKRLFNGINEIVPNSEWKTIKQGQAKGKLIGCNLSSLLKLAGTKYFPDFKDSILFLEVYKRTAGEVQFCLEQLKQIGVFDKINGIVIGFNYCFQDDNIRKALNINANFEDLVLEATKDYNIPILKINEFGHKCDNAFLPIGVNIELNSTNKTIKIINEFVN